MKCVLLFSQILIYQDITNMNMYYCLLMYNIMPLATNSAKCYWTCHFLTKNMRWTPTWIEADSWQQCSIRITTKNSMMTLQIFYVTNFQPFRCWKYDLINLDVTLVLHFSFLWPIFEEPESLVILIQMLNLPSLTKKSGQAWNTIQIVQISEKCQKSEG